jgi:hypothetical protein
MKSIAWHEECLRNMTARLAEQILMLERMQTGVQRLQSECLALHGRIQCAKLAGKTEMPIEERKPRRGGNA